MQWLVVAIGGALGALGRYGIACLFPPTVSAFPWATWIANCAGSLAMGVCYVLIVEQGLFVKGLSVKVKGLVTEGLVTRDLSEEWRLLLMVGFLGALTTFSTFALETVLLWQQQQAQRAVIYFSTSMIACLLCVIVSIWLTQRLF